MIAYVVRAEIVAGREQDWERSWHENAPGMKNNKGHHFRHLLRSTENPQEYLIYGLWDSEEELRAALAKPTAQAGIKKFTAMTVGDGPAKVVYELVGTDENL